MGKVGEATTGMSYLSSKDKRRPMPWVWVSCFVEVDEVGLKAQQIDEMSDMLG
jgi:hypothetical protein